MKKCIVCEKPFTPKRSDQKICGSDECKKGQAKIWNENRKKAKPPKRRKRCSECKKLFTPKHSLQKTCGDDLCIKSRKNSRRKKEEFEFECEVCGEKTWSARKNTKLCGKKSCRDYYRNEFNKAGKYKEKLRNKLIKKAKVKGRFTKEESEFILENRLKGKTLVFIAEKLKRTYSSVEKKASDLLLDVKYQGFIADIQIQIDIEKEEKRKKPKKETVNYWNKKLNEVFNK